MKKRDLKKLALLGLASGMLVATQTCLHATDSTNALSVQSEGLPEADLLSQLSPEAQLLYMGLDQEGQALARLITDDEIGQGNTYRSGSHSCGGGKCGGGGGSYQGGGSSGHSCGGGGGVVYQGGSSGHSCGGGGSYQGGSSGHSCGGGGVIYQGGGSPYGGHSCGNASSHCSGSSHCANGMGPGQPQGQPMGRPMNMPMNQSVSQPMNMPKGQTQTLQNSNRSMPQFENQPKYQQDVPVDPKVVPGSKPTAYLDQPVKPGRYVAQVAVTQESLEAQLNKEGKETFKALSPEGKKLAVTLANQDCAGKNTCKGLNSCKSDDNSCAGQGGCKGTSKGRFTDKNQAVKVAAMKEKRQTALRGY